MSSGRRRLSVDAYEKGVRAGDRGVLAQAITLVESRHPEDGALAQTLLTRLLPHTGGARRVGVTGVPGVGKSTFVDAFGMMLLGKGKRVAVLAIDPTSSVSGGSILGDKTRMARLALEENAYIRPSPSSLSPGGIARRTRETMLLCEAAGFDVILVETVGVGQGETAVSAMVDFFLVLALPGAGDELQGIKKGILELADAIAVNKADGDALPRVRHALGDLQSALRYLPKRRPSFPTRALAISGLTGVGLEDLWSLIEEHNATLSASGELTKLRAHQQESWMWSLVDERLMTAFRSHEIVQALIPIVETKVRQGQTTAPLAVDELFAAYLRDR